MKPAPFEYHAPRNVKEAVDLLATLDNARILAGGQSLVPMMNFRYVIVDHIVDLGAVGDLRGVAVGNGVPAGPRTQLSRDNLHRAYRAAVARVADPTATLAYTPKRVLRALREGGPGQTSERCAAESPAAAPPWAPSTMRSGSWSRPA